MVPSGAGSDPSNATTGKPATRIIATGIVLLPDAGPAAGAVVHATRADHGATPFARTTTDGSGRFRLVTTELLDVPAGGIDVTVRAEAPARGLTSLAERVVIGAGESARCLVLLLRPAATVKGRLVDASSAAVPAGEVLLLTWPVVSHPWENGTSDGDRIAATAAADGRFEIVIQPGDARAFFRRTAGVFSKSRRFSLAAGGTIDLGDVRVGGAPCTLVVVVKNAAGAPVERAAIRMDPDDGIQRFAAGGGDTWIHARTDVNGEAPLSFEALESPLRIAVGHEDYETVEVLYRRDLPSRGRVEVVLEEKPRIFVRVRGSEGEAMPKGLAPEIRVLRLDRGEALPARRISIDGAGDLPLPQDGEVSTATSLSWATEWPSARAVGDAGDYEWRVSAPGRYRVTVVAGPGLQSAAELELTPEAPVAAFDCRLPDGRAVRIVSPFPESSVGSGADWRVWGGTPAQFPDAWPSTGPETAMARSTGIALGPPRAKGVREDRWIWVPWDWTVLVARDLEVLTAGGPGSGGGPHDGTGEARPRPPLLRQTVPAGESPVVRFDIPDEIAGIPGADLVIRLSAWGERTPLEDWTVDVRSTESGFARTLRTDSSGEARLRVPAGTYIVDLTRDRAPAGPRTIQVSADPGAVAVLTLDLAERDWGVPPR